LPFAANVHAQLAHCLKLESYPSLSAVLNMRAGAGVICASTKDEDLMAKVPVNGL